MNSSLSSSNAFNQLDSRIQKWIWYKGWVDLRDIQSLAIEALLKGSNDLIISANTSGGKTEAAFLPIISETISFVEAKDIKEGVVVLYVSPMKALVNDQYERLSDLCSNMYLNVVPWHGDVSYSFKEKGLKGNPSVVLMTPESLESFFVNKGSLLETIFQHLKYFVIDELHAFMGTERGKQLQSLMYRLETVLGNSVRRVGLSATLGNMEMAKDYLRIGGQVDVVTSQELRRDFQVKIFAEKEEVVRGSKSSVKVSDQQKQEATDKIVHHIYRSLRGTSNLIFINSRRYVESYAQSLKKLCEEKSVPNEFYPHHGLLSKSVRERAESLLKEDKRPVSIVCTSTLELGIDIGNVHSVAQIGAPFSVSGLRQRLGRSGRRMYDPAILRVFILEKVSGGHQLLSDQLHKDLVQSISMIRLLVRGWYEPPEEQAPHLSTFIQQLISMIEQKGGARVVDLYTVLCRKGAFFSMSQDKFVYLLRLLGNEENNILMSDSSRCLYLTPKAEDYVKNYDFYAVFQKNQEFKLVYKEKTIGLYLVSGPLFDSMYIYVSGKTWKVMDIDVKEKILQIDIVKKVSQLAFRPCHGALNHVILKEMFKVYIESVRVSFIDQVADEMLWSVRAIFKEYGLDRDWFIDYEGVTYFFPWSGAKVYNTLLIYFHSKGLKVAQVSDLAMAIHASRSEIISVLEYFDSTVSIFDLATYVKNKATRKYDYLLDEYLLCYDYAHSSLDEVLSKKLVKNILLSKTPYDILVGS